MEKGIILCGHGTKSQQGISSFFKVYGELEVKLSEYKKENKRLFISKNQNDIIYEIMVETGRVPRP